MAKGSARRAKVIKAMIAFVVILALLTFFSNTIMNLTIPKVAGQYASRGNLSYSYSKRGYVEVANQTEIKGLEGREVEEVLVDTYASVKKGDPIIKLKGVEDSEDLKSKKDSLKTKEREKAYDARRPKKTTDYSSYTDRIKTDETTLSEAKATLKKVQNKKSTVSKNEKIIDEESTKAVSLEASVNAAAKTVEDLKAQIDKINSEIAPLQSQIDVFVALGTPTPAPDELETPTTEIAKLTKMVNEKKAEIKKLENQLDAANDRMEEDAAKLAACQSKIEKAQAEIAATETLPSEKAAKNAVTAAQNELNAANKDYKNAKVEAGITADEAKDAVIQRDEEIEQLKKEIAELEAKAKITEIKAPADGMVYNISVNAGDLLTDKGTVGYIIPETDAVYTCTFTFESSVAQNIWAGQTLEITSGYAESCTVISKRPNPDNPREETLVKCRVETQTAWPGEEIIVNAGRGNDNYKCVVPAGAVNEDNSGYFVYAIIGSSTPLGDKYVVKRVDVTIQKTDGTNTAIEGEGLDKYDVMIVIRAEKPLEDGQRVRLEDYTAK